LFDDGWVQSYCQAAMLGQDTIMDDLGAELRAHVSSGRFQMFLYWYKVLHSVCFEINLTWVMFLFTQNQPNR